MYEFDNFQISSGNTGIWSVIGNDLSIGTHSSRNRVECCEERRWNILPSVLALVHRLCPMYVEVAGETRQVYEPQRIHHVRCLRKRTLQFSVDGAQPHNEKRITRFSPD